jgi:tellurite resistance-related uncharacterized protein
MGKKSENLIKLALIRNRVEKIRNKNKVIRGINDKYNNCHNFGNISVLEKKMKFEGLDDAVVSLYPDIRFEL